MEDGTGCIKWARIVLALLLCIPTVAFGQLLEPDKTPTFELIVDDQVEADALTAPLAPAADIDQVRNEGSDCASTQGSNDGICDADWVNGNVGAQTGHYVEGYSIPYRVRMTELPTDGTVISIVLGYDIKHSGAHAIDYLTHYERINNPDHSLVFGHAAEDIDPLEGVSGVGALVTTFPVPAPSNNMLVDPDGAGPKPPALMPISSFNALPAGEKVFTLYGGTLLYAEFDTAGTDAEGDLTADQSEARVRVAFTASSATAVLAWGGHIGTRAEWGLPEDPQSAGGISGSPYHMRLLDWNLTNLGNQDRSLSAVAVFLPPPICAVTPLSQTVCQGSQACINENATGGTPPFSWAWSGPNGFSATTQNICINNIQPAAAGQYRVIVTDSEDKADTCFSEIIVNPTPACSISGAGLVCPNQTSVQYCAPAGMDNYSWTISGNGSFAGGPPGNVQCVTVNAGSLCGKPFLLMLTVTDNNCVSQCQRFIDVDDNEAPVITCPAGGTVQCLADVPAPAGGSATDNCDASVSITRTAGTLQGGPCGGTVSHRYIATDDCGNADTCFQVWTVNDTQDPVITCPAGGTVQCLADVPAPAGGSATDNCDQNVAITRTAGTLQGGACGGTVSHRYIATDDCGNADTCFQVWIVNDTVDPVITCPNGGTVQCLADVPAPAGGSATDNCDTNVEILRTAGSLVGNTCGGTVTHRYIARDDCGNADTCFQVWTVNDTQDPVITCPPGGTVQCLADVPAPAGGSATDNCDQNVAITRTAGTLQGGACGGTVTHRYIATDDCGNADTCFQVWTVNDTQRPVVQFCPPNDSVECPAVPVFGNPIFTDNCDANLTITFRDDRVNGACAQEYCVTRTWIARDDCQNADSCKQRICVVDNTPPTILQCAPARVEVECGGPLPAAQAPTVTDCDPNVAPFYDSSFAPGCGATGILTRNWTARDACGNINTCVQLIVIVDNTPPRITCPPPDTVLCNGPVPDTATDLASFIALGGSASDICGDVTITHVGDVSDGQECPETITRTYRATDECLNTADCTQLIVIECCPDTFCTFTKGAYGSEGGNHMGYTTLGLIQYALATPMTIGVAGTRSVTFRLEDAQCIIDRLPGGSTPTTLPVGLGSVELNHTTCQTSPALPLKNNGQWENNFLAQLVTLSLNARLPGNEAGLGLCPWMTGVKTIHIDASIFTALTNLGLPHTVNGLIALANRAIAGLSTGGATLLTIHNAVSSINEGFDECALLSYCSDVPPVSAALSVYAASRTVPGDYTLDQNYPNPFNAATEISYSLAKDGEVDLGVYNVLGQRVATLVNEFQTVGRHTVSWTGADDNGNAVASGVYFYRLQMAEAIQTRKMVLLK